MEGASNGGMLYHEVQESKLCAVHCVNTVLQGPFFSEFDLAALASDLDGKERQMMLGGSMTVDFLSEESHNVSLDGDFSIQVLQKALEVWDLLVIPLDSPVAEPAQIHPELENAFICHLQDHWFCIRKVNGEWYNFDSVYAAPQHLSKFYLSAYLDSLKGFGWSIFLVRGNFPKDFPISSSEASNGYGQWLSPNDAERITESCNSRAPPQRLDWASQRDSFRESEMLLDMENDDLKAAIAASLMDSSAAALSSEAASEVSAPQNEQTDRVELSAHRKESEMLLDMEKDELKAAIAASLMDSSAVALSSEAASEVSAPQNEPTDREEVSGHRKESAGKSNDAPSESEPASIAESAVSSSRDKVSDTKEKAA